MILFYYFNYSKREKTSMSLRVAFLIDKIECYTEKQKKCIDSRLKKKTLRSFKKYSKERKERYEEYTEYIKCNNFYMVMFLEFLKNNNNLFSNYKDEYIKNIREKGYWVIEKYEGCERENDYLDMCDIIKNDINIATMLYKYQK